MAQVVAVEEGTVSQAAAYYLRDMWRDLGDPRGSRFPLTAGGPWTLLTISALMALLSNVLLPALMRHRKPLDLRPLMVVYNGLMFGINGAGFLVSFFLTDGGVSGWSCTAANPASGEFRQEAIVYLGYVYMHLKVLDMVRPVFSALRKKHHQSSWFHHVYLATGACLIHGGIFFYPGGIFTFLPLSDTLLHSFLYAYYILSSAGDELQKSCLWWKKYLLIYQLAHFVLLFGHGLWFYLIPNCSGPPFVKGLQVFHAGLSLVGFTLYYRRLLFSRSVPSKQQQQLKSKQKNR